jgi:DNA repair protein RecO (recombination protein O)
MPLVSDRCICLRKVEYSETSQILTLFARAHGMTRVIAKGAHRKTRQGASKFGGGIDLLDLGEAVFSHSTERDLAPLTEWSLQDGHLELRRALRPVYLAQYAAELVSMTIEEHDPHPELFDRLQQTLVDLATPRREEEFLSFQLDLLREAGYMPQLQSCASCGGSVGDRAYFSPSLSGVICRNCEQVTPDRSEIDARLLRLLQSVINLPRAGGRRQRLPQLTRHQTDPLNRLIADHVQYTLSRRLRLVPYVLNGNGRH